DAFVMILFEVCSSNPAPSLVLLASPGGQAANYCPHLNAPPKPPDTRGWLLARFPTWVAVLGIFIAGAPGQAGAQPATFAGNSQHTALYDTAAQRLNVAR